MSEPRTDEKRPRRHRVLWGLLYATLFLLAFGGSALFKLAWNPLAEKTAVEWDDTVGTVHRDLPYGEKESNTFDLYLPADGGKDAYGLVVYLHAGGFTSGDKADDVAMLQWLCSLGYVAAGVNYTLLSEEHPTANVLTMSREVQASIPAIQEASCERGYPLDAMAVAGGSAGGTLALLYAYRDAAQSPLPVRFVFEAVGPASFVAEDWTSYGLDQSPEAAAALFSGMAGAPITPSMIEDGSAQAAVRDISPSQWVTEGSVPALCAYGVHDRIAPFGSAVRLREALEAHGVPHDFIEFPHSGHGLQNDDDRYALYLDKIKEYLATYMPL